jgi:hypothetical protein
VSAGLDGSLVRAAYWLTCAQADRHGADDPHIVRWHVHDDGKAWR